MLIKRFDALYGCGKQAYIGDVQCVIAVDICYIEFFAAKFLDALYVGCHLGKVGNGIFTVAVDIADIPFVGCGRQAAHRRIVYIAVIAVADAGVGLRRGIYIVAR